MHQRLAGWRELLFTPPDRTIVTADDNNTIWSGVFAAGMGCAVPAFIAWRSGRWTALDALGYAGLVAVYFALFLASGERIRAFGWTRRQPLLLLACFGVLGCAMFALSGDGFLQPIVLIVPLGYAVQIFPLIAVFPIAVGYLALLMLGAWLGQGSLDGLIWTLTGHAALMGFIVAFGRLSVAQATARHRADQLALTLANERDELARLAKENAELYAQARLSATLAERNRLARELHDTIAQGLTAITMQLEAAQRGWERDPARAHGRVVRAHELARETLGDVRRSVWDLAAPLVHGDTLHTALAEQAARFTASTAIVAAYHHDGPEATLPSAAAMQVLRIVQEALHNVAKHAQATAVEVRSTTQPDRLVVAVSDNGVGFDPSAVVATATSGFGLRSIAERANLAQATLHIESAPGVGTTITLCVAQGDGDYSLSPNGSPLMRGDVGN